MPLVRILRPTFVSPTHRAPGDEVEVDGELAKALIALGEAELVRDGGIEVTTPHPSGPEKAVRRRRK